MSSKYAALLMVGALCGTCVAGELETTKNDSGLRFSEMKAKKEGPSSTPVAAGVYEAKHPALTISHEAAKQAAGTAVPAPKAQKFMYTDKTKAKITGAEIGGGILGTAMVAAVIHGSGWVTMGAVGFGVIGGGFVVAAVAVGAAIGFVAVSTVQGLSDVVSGK
ncbi:MAG: hypothetical protein AAB262_05230 [Elusimicrobiota bacterium]